MAQSAAQRADEAFARGVEQQRKSDIAEATVRDKALYDAFRPPG